MAEQRPTGGVEGAVAIVGMACVLPGAADLETYAANLAGGVDAITDVPEGRVDPVFYDPAAAAPDRFYCRKGGFVDAVADFDPAAFGIMPVAVEGAEPDQLLALAVATRALADAGDPHRRVDPASVGVILGRGGYIGAGLRRLEQRVQTAEQLVVSLRSLLPELDEARLAAVKAEFVERLGPDRPESAIDLVPNLAASRISNRLDLRGPSHSIDAACASSLVAIDQSLDLLGSGRCDLVVTGGVHHCHDLTLWSVFTQLGAISRRQQLRAFDRGADGLLIGEGTAMLVLKRLAEAEAAGDRVYAVIRGSGVASDGRATSLMSPSTDGQVLAVERAWKRAGLAPERIGLLEAHGTGTPAGDAVELETLRRVFGPPLGDRAGLGSVKSMIGHAMPAAGAAGVVKAALAIWQGLRLPTLHAEEPSPLVAETRFRLVRETEPWDPDGTRVAGVDAFGFGGINGHVVLEEHLASTGRAAGRPARNRPAGPSLGAGRAPRGGNARAAEPAPGGSEVVLALAGRDLDELATKLRAVAAGTLDVPAMASLGGEGPSARDGAGPCRLAVVAPTAKRLALAEKVLERGRPFNGREDVWFQPAPLVPGDGGQVSGGDAGALAMVFPGLEPAFAPRLDEVAAAVGFDTGRILAGSGRLEVLGPAAIDAGRLVHRALDRLGVRPDLMAGHSVGEWTAQIVTGMTPLDALEPLLDQLHPGRLRHPDVAYLALGAPVRMAGELIAGIDGVVISHDNCPHQSVVCGHDAAIAAVQERARQRQVMAQLLPFRSGFHTPMFAPFVRGMRELFGSLPIERPSVPVWSATTASPYPADDPDAVRALTVEHLTRPVGWRGLVERLYEHGVRVFVEAGVGSLVGFVDDILCDRPHLAVPAHHPKRDGVAQLRRTLAALWCAGATVDPHGELAAPPAAPPVPAAAPAGLRRLRLGRTLVRDLTPLARSSAASPAPPVPGGAPVLAAYRATVDSAADASRRVLEQWSRHTVPAPTPPPAPGRVERPVGGERPGTLERREPGGERPDTLERREEFSLQREPAYVDHAIFSQPPGWPDERDRFPIVPLTAMIARFVAVATELRPDLVPVGVEDVRATRWLVVDPPTTTTVRAAVERTDPGGTVSVRVAIEGHARADVLLGARYPERPAESGPRPNRTRPLPYPPADIYTERWLFHGAAYQGIEAIAGWDETGIDGQVRVLAAPGAVLDNAGQVLGLWVALALPERRVVLPTTIDRVTFFGPPPPVGSRVDCRADVGAVEDDRIVAELQLTGPGGTWARVEGWEERRFDTTNRVFEVIRSPQDRVIAEVTRHGWAWVAETWRDPASREMIARRYLDAAERAELERRNPRAQRATLLGRVAAKDLLRQRRWGLGAGPIFPAEITLTNDEAGRPEVHGAVEPGLSVSIAHRDGVGVAHAARGRPVGIDIEALEERTEHFADRVLTEGERELLAAMDGSCGDRLTTLWAVKEAAAKAAGTGLAGRPKAWEVAEARGGRFRIGDLWVSAEPLIVDRPTLGRKEYVVAWTV